jgi:hypothetical protein
MASKRSAWQRPHDAAYSSRAPSTVWDRCEPNEAGGLGVVEIPELGRLDHKHVCGRLAEARNAGQDVRSAGTGPSLRCATF